MRGAGLVTAQRDGRVIRYALADPEIFAACQLLRDIIGRRLSADPAHREPSPSQVTHA
jgi:DNA-binding transcriptional ArsR family regulator